jgi:hypothetical protein
LPPQYSLKEVLEVFRVNNRYNKNRLIWPDEAIGYEAKGL